MARSHFTLAALVASAVPDFDPVMVTPLREGFEADYESALVADAAGRAVIVRLPTSRSVELSLANELRSLDVLTAGVRSRLGFEIPVVCGRAPVGNTFGLVFEQLPGSTVRLGDVLAGTVVPVAVGRAIASIHDVPTKVVSDAGLSFVSAAGAQQQSRDVVERAVATSMVPERLAQRWTRAVTSATMWQFEPTVIHGSLSPSNFLFGADSVSAVQGWGTLHVGDPARDLAWASNADPAAVDEIFEAYHDVRLSSADPHLRKRAFLYSELEIARWLLHGVTERSEDIVEDATDMMARLLETIGADPDNAVGTDTRPVMTVSEVQTMLSAHDDDDTVEIDVVSSATERD